MIKGAATILFLGFAVVIGAYYLGGVSSHDPTARGKEARAAIHTGMTWEEVVEGAGDPMRFQPFHLVKEKIDGEYVDVERLGTKLRYAADLIPGDIENGAYKQGFIFEYTFSHQVAFQVLFDGDGEAISIDDIKTAADLLDTRGD